MKKRKSQPISDCVSILIFIGFFTFIGYGFYKIFQNPFNPETFIGQLKAYGLCLGFAILVFAVLSLYSILSAKRGQKRIVKTGKEFPVCCERFIFIKNSDKRGEQTEETSPAQTPLTPVYFMLSFTDIGLYLSEIPA